MKQNAYPPSYGYSPNSTPAYLQNHQDGYAKGYDLQNTGYSFQGSPPPAQYAQGYQNQGNVIIHVNPSTGSICQFCSSAAPVVQRTTVGATAVIWGCVLFCATGCLCCIPCCIPECLDKEYVCTACSQVRSTRPADFC